MAIARAATVAISFSYQADPGWVPNQVIAVCHCHSQAARQNSVARQGRHSRGFKETELAGMRTVPPPYPTHIPQKSQGGGNARVAKVHKGERLLRVIGPATHPKP